MVSTPEDVIEARPAPDLDCGAVNDPRRMRLGYVIRSARELQGMSVQELADRLGVGRSTVYAWQDGKQEPGLLMLGPLCDALGVSPDLFAELPEEPPSPVETYLRSAAARGAREGARRTRP